MLRKNGRRMTIDSGSPKAACGSATPSGLPDRPSWRMRMNSGRIATAVGNSSPNMNSVYIASRPRNRIRGEDERRQRRAAHRDADRDDRDDHAVAAARPRTRQRSRPTGRRRSCRRPTGRGSARPGSAASWPLSLKPPRTAYTIGTRIAAATASRIVGDVPQTVRRAPLVRATARTAVGVGARRWRMPRSSSAQPFTRSRRRRCRAAARTAGTARATTSAHRNRITASALP